MNLRINKKLLFKDRTELIIKGSNAPINGVIKTNRGEYSVDFINRWFNFGIVKLK